MSAAVPPKYEDVARQPYYNPGYNINAGRPSNGNYYGATQPQQQPVIIVGAPAQVLPDGYRHHRDNNCGQTDGKFNCTRGFQCTLAMVALGLQCGLLSYDPPDWYYWLWLLIVPITTIIATMRSGCTEQRTPPGKDAGYAFCWMVQIAGVAGVYFGFYEVRTHLANLIVTLNLVTCGVLCLSHWIMACCCQGS